MTKLPGGDQGVDRGLDLAALGVVPLDPVGDHAPVQEHVRLGLPVGEVDALEDLERPVLGLLDEVGEVVGAGVEHGDGVLVGEQAELAVLVDGLAVLGRAGVGLELDLAPGRGLELVARVQDADPHEGRQVAGLGKPSFSFRTTGPPA